MHLNVRTLVIGSVLGMLYTLGYAEEQRAFKMECQHTDDRVTSTGDADHLMINVRSPRGISSLTIERSGDHWPANMSEKTIIQLHLKGLEHLEISSGDTKLLASISSQTGQPNVYLDGQEDQPLKETDALWIDLTVLTNSGQTSRTIPIEDGLIRLQLPRQIFAANPRSIKIGWIDFYR